MGLLRNIADKLKGKKQEAIEIDYNPQEEPEGLRRDDVDMHDKKQRERYVKACLEQMAEASKELETLGSEYNLVTSYLTDMEEQDLKDYFPEFRKYDEECRFQGCRHIHEPGCRVKEALEDGKISSIRYEDYLSLYEELKEKRRY